MPQQVHEYNKLSVVKEPDFEDNAIVVIPVPALGKFVYKQDIRQVCGLVKDYRWRQHIKICLRNQVFLEAYSHYLTNNCVPREIAKMIIEKAYEGDEIKIKFIME